MGQGLVVPILGAVGLAGLWLGRQHLAGGRRPPLLLGGHILLAVAAFEALIVTVQAMPAEGGTRLGGQAALGLMAIALGLGLGGPLLGRDSASARRTMLAAHAAAGSAAVLLGIAWAMGV